MNTTITARGTEATRNSILEAAGGLFLERRIEGFSVQEVAGRAGLTHRTVYRYFPTRHELMRATVQHLAPGMAEEPFSEVSTVHDWIGALAARLAFVEANFEIFRGLMVAALTSDELLQSDELLRERDTHRREVFRRQFPHLSEVDARRTFATLRHLMSSASYVFMRLRFGMSPADATEAIRSGGSQIVEQATLRNRAASQRRKRR